MPELNATTRANLTTVRDAIAAQPGRFSMDEWCTALSKDGKVTDSHFAALKAFREHTCGTVACIGGAAEALLFPPSNEVRDSDEVGAALGLNRDETANLFFMLDAEQVGFERVTAEHAVIHLDMIRAGKPVSWLAVFGELPALPEVC